MSNPTSEISFIITDRTACHRLLGAFNIHLDDCEDVTDEDVESAGPWGSEDQPIIDPNDFVWYSYDVLKYDRKAGQWEDVDGGLLLGVWPECGAGAEAFIEDCIDSFCHIDLEKFYKTYRLCEITQEEWEEYRDAYDRQELEKIEAYKQKMSQRFV